MSRIVLDTNSLIQSIPSKSIYHAIWQSSLDGTNTLCVSTEILAEYEEILQRLTNVDTAQLVIELIVNNPHTLMFSPYYHFALITSDPDDNKFVDCAIVASAKYIVTEDHHYDVLKSCSFPKVDVIDLDSFLREVQQLGSYGFSSPDAPLLNEPSIPYGQV